MQQKQQQPEKAAIYKRVSTKDQDEENQDPAIKEYIKAQGYEIVKTYQDHGKSAFKADVKRPEFDQMIEDAKDGLFNVIVVFNRDRFSRRPSSEVMALIRDLNFIYGVRVETIEDTPIKALIEQLNKFPTMGELGRTMGNFLIEILTIVEAERAHRESEVKSQQIRAGQKAILNGEKKTKSGKKIGGQYKDGISTRHLVKLKKQGHDANDNKPMSTREIADYYTDVKEIPINHSTVSRRISAYKRAQKIKIEQEKEVGIHAR